MTPGTFITLGEVGERALQDEAFFEALVKDTHGALQAAGLNLSPEDERWLSKILKDNSAQVLIEPIDWFRRYHSRNPGRKCLEFLDRLVWKSPVPGPPSGHGHGSS